MDTPDVMVARAALDAAVAAPDTPAAPAEIDALIVEVEKQALALARAEAPAAVAAIEAAIPTPKASWQRHLLSMAERSVSTFAFTFLGIITVTSLSDPAALKTAALASGMSVAVYLRVEAGKYLSTPEAS